MASRLIQRLLHGWGTTMRRSNKYAEENRRLLSSLLYCGHIKWVVSIKKTQACVIGRMFMYVNTNNGCVLLK